MSPGTPGQPGQHLGSPGQPVKYFSHSGNTYGVHASTGGEYEGMRSVDEVAAPAQLFEEVRGGQLGGTNAASQVYALLPLWTAVCTGLLPTGLGGKLTDRERRQLCSTGARHGRLCAGHGARGAGTRSGGC